jgi:NADPH:quinone reductase-like Zn-dependent oxidoreductase
VHGNLKAGDRVLILGGASSTGAAAIQLAKIVGATVFATASTRNLDLVRGYGADRVVDYTTEKWDALPGKFPLIYDTVGEENGWERAKAILEKDGKQMRSSRIV